MPKATSNPPVTPGEPGYGAEHYERLGRFIAQFARAEVGFHMAFRHYSQMPIAESRLFFGGARTIDIIDNTKKLIKLHKVETGLQDDFDMLARHFRYITNVRNNLIHYEFRFLERTYRISNIALVKNIENLGPIDPVSIEDLENMGKDLISVWTRLTYHHIIADSG